MLLAPIQLIFMIGLDYSGPKGLLEDVDFRAISTDLLEVNCLRFLRLRGYVRLFAEHFDVQSHCGRFHQLVVK